MMKRHAVFGAVLALSVWALPVAAQPQLPSWVFVRSTAGDVWLVANGNRIPIPIYPSTDEQIMALPETPLWMVPAEDGSRLVAGPRPEWAAGGAAPAAPSGPSWQAVARWEGRGSKTTEPVHVASRSWRIVYSARKTTTGHDQLCITAHAADSGRLVSNGCYQGSDSTFVHSGPGAVYLDIRGVNDGWTVSVEDQR